MYKIPKYTMSLVKEGFIKCQEKSIDNPDNAKQMVQSYLGGKDREHFIVILVNIKNEICGVHTVAIGSLNSAIVHPREVYKAAVVANAAGIIVAHNHPSGDVRPSENDKEMTKRLVKAGKIMGIEFLDHLIVANDQDHYFSFRRSGYIELYE